MKAREAEGDMEAAAAPAITSERAKTRTISFMISYPLKDFVIDRFPGSGHLE
jgi:hypothetical protein